MTGPEAINGLTSSLAEFGHNMVKVLAGDPSQKTPQRHRAAVANAQKEDWLTTEDQFCLCKVLEVNIKAVDAYSALDPMNQVFQKMWIRDTVAGFKTARAATNSTASV